MIKVSALIVTYKRETLLLNCLRSLKELKESFELQLILVSNGDKVSPKVQEELSENFQNLTVLEEKRMTPGVARNLGLNYVTGDWVFFIDDDATLPVGYGKNVLELIKNNPLWDAFGGPDSMPEQSNNFQQSLAIALSSPFCTGPTFRRHFKQNKDPYIASEKDLTSCHLWVKSKVIKESKIRFAEEFHRGEETTFLQDLEKMGAHLWAVPSLSIFHERRKTFKQLLRPLFYGGYYRSHITKSILTPFSLPSLMVLLHSLLFVIPEAFILLSEIYFLLIATTSFILCARERKLSNVALVSVLHYTIVMLYGVGFLYERVRRRF